MLYVLLSFISLVLLLGERRVVFQARLEVLRDPALARLNKQINKSMYIYIYMLFCILYVYTYIHIYIYI